ncbi:MAG: transcriptional regulator NrdR [Firmicutes bacterium]|nr:transcriptional regulator NrdR [Bacillota bacterium]
MKCPACHFPDSKVLDSRPLREGEEIRRRRECLSCHYRFTSYERIEEMPIIVVKRDGRRERFDRGKILHGIMTACEKRKIPLEAIEALVDQVEREIANLPETEVSSKRIGEAALRALRELDEVAYVRFASVYRQFIDIEGFRRELDYLLKSAAKE